jgi:hypothetical protein
VRTASLDRRDEVPVYLDESLQVLIGRGDEGFALLPLFLFLRVMEGCKEPEYGGLGRNGSVMFLAPATLLVPSLLKG